MWLSNYWRITIIYIWKRNLPPAFVAQHEMNPAQLSHFVSLHDCSLALSTPLTSALRPGPPQVLIIASIPLVTTQSPRVWGQEGQGPMMWADSLSYCEYQNSSSHSGSSLFRRTNIWGHRKSAATLTFMWHTFRPSVSVPGWWGAKLQIKGSEPFFTAIAWSTFLPADQPMWPGPEWLTHTGAPQVGTLTIRETLLLTVWG